jgi:hypothetical protein
MEKILLTNCNRDGAQIWFEPVGDDVYTIHSNKSYVLEYTRFIFERAPADAELYDHIYSDGTKVFYKAFDPSGGPYIEVGRQIGNKRIVRIYVKDNKTLFKIIDI